MKVERDTQLDAYRALTMIYIVCVLHVLILFWGVTNKFFMMFLWEMPAIFFIAGASMQYAKVKNFKETVINRLFRVMVPYWIYLVFTLILYCLIGIFGGQYYKFILVDWSAEDYLMAFGGVCVNGVLAPGQQWFVFPYMIVSCVFPLIRKIVDCYTWKIPLLTALLLFLLHEFVRTYCCQEETLERIFLEVTEILCYLVFFLIGYLYYKRLSTWRCACICFISLFFYLIMIGGEMPNMQEHKFPPDFLFLVYGIITLTIWSMILPKVTIPRHSLLAIWNNRSFSLFLYQDWVILVILIIRKFCELYLCWDKILWVAIFCSVILAFVLNTYLSKYTHAMEQKVVGFIRRCYG